MRRFVPFVLSLLVLVPAYAAAQTIVPTPTAMLRPGDHFQIEVWRNKELSGNFEVAQDSGVFHPIYRHVRVGGVPFPVAEQRIREFLLTREAEPQFVFQPLMRVYVGGDVRGQNQYYFPELSVGQAITEAGGSTAPDDRKRVRLIREGVEAVANLDRGEIAELLQVPIRSGDQIILEDRPSISRNVIRPALGVIQTVAGLVLTYVSIRAVFGSN
jgi:protein involved in polysaccharide export with SLBB domain